MFLDWQYTPYALPSFLAALMSLGAGWVAWRRQQTTAGSGYFVMFCLAAFLWTFAYALEIVTVDMNGKLLWTRIEYIGIMSVLVLLCDAFCRK